MFASGAVYDPFNTFMPCVPFCSTPVGAFSGDFTIHLSLQCEAFSGAMQTEKLKAQLFSDPLRTVVPNDWCLLNGIYMPSAAELGT